MMGPYRALGRYLEALRGPHRPQRAIAEAAWPGSRHKKGMIGAYERGQVLPGVRTLRALAEAFGVPADDLLARRRAVLCAALDAGARQPPSPRPSAPKPPRAPTPSPGRWHFTLTPPVQAR